MSQMEQQTFQQNHNLSNVQSYLIKYCWSKVTSLQNDTRQMIANCQDTILLYQFRDIFVTFILPYFKVQRTIFNRIREYFVHFMYDSLSCAILSTDNVVSFLRNYQMMCIDSGACDDFNTQELSYKLIKKANSRITEVS